MYTTHIFYLVLFGNTRKATFACKGAWESELPIEHPPSPGFFHSEQLYVRVFNLDTVSFLGRALEMLTGTFRVLEWYPSHKCRLQAEINLKITSKSYNKLIHVSVVRTDGSFWDFLKPKLSERIDHELQLSTEGTSLTPRYILFENCNAWSILCHS